ncbi:MAG: 6-bladed beta-propeller, partial [Gemmatimonadota bacterium]
GQTALVFEQVLRLGSGADTNQMFGQVWDVALDSRSRVYVLDRSVATVQVFSANGRHLFQIGRRGGGPGEFLQAWRLGVGAGDTLLVFDASGPRLSYFAPDGRFVRSVVLAGSPSNVDMAELPDRNLVLAGFDRATRNTLHIYDRSGALLRSFRPVEARELAGFETSLLGGRIDVLPSGDILFTQLSPYSLEIWSSRGVLKWRCEDRNGGLTDPAAVVVRRGDGQGLMWGRFVHSASVFALSDSLFLNVAMAPADTVPRFDLVSRSCQLLARQNGGVPLLLTKRTPDRARFAGATNADVPGAAVYRLRH